LLLQPANSIKVITLPRTVTTFPGRPRITPGEPLVISGLKTVLET